MLVAQIFNYSLGIRHYSNLDLEKLERRNKMDKNIMLVPYCCPDWEAEIESDIFNFEKDPLIIYVLYKPGEILREYIKLRCGNCDGFLALMIDFKED